MYIIEINEAQRLALLALIPKADSDSEDKPLAYWHGMLERVPAEENSNPGIVHSFCC